jgi:uncharacterized membrane protein HdeD (DUF308 family)
MSRLAPAAHGCYARTAVSTEILAIRWSWLVASGTALILLGLLSIAFADAAGTALITFLGCLLVLGGGLQLAGAIRVRAWRAGPMGLLVAGLRVAVGLLFLLAPAAWAASIALLLAVFLLVDGAFRVLMAVQARPLPGYRTLLAGGCAALLLGLLILSKWPGNNAFALGLLFGIHLLLDGWATLMLATAARAALRP